MTMLVLTIYWSLCLITLLAATVIEYFIKESSHQFHGYLRSTRIAKYVIGWYLISISFTLYNKYLLQYWQGGFPFPVFVTVIHMTIKFLLTRVLNACAPVEKKIKHMPFSKSIRSAIPIGVCTAVDVAFSNLSFLFISVTFYTILKSGALLWILFWGIILHLEPLTWQICAICALVSGGVSMASYGEAAFSWMGFALVTAACCLSGLRWGLTQIMLEEQSQEEEGAISSQRNDGQIIAEGGNHHHQQHQQHHHQPLAILYHISLASALSCVPVFLLIELKPFLDYRPLTEDSNVSLEITFILVIGGLISFLLILAEVQLVQISSSLTMGLFGVCKEFVTVALSMAVFHDQVSVLNVLGLITAIIGVICYRQYKSVPRPRHIRSRPSSRGGNNGISMTALGDNNTPYLEVQHHHSSYMFHLDDDGEAEQEEEEIDLHHQQHKSTTTFSNRSGTSSEPALT